MKNPGSTQSKSNNPAQGSESCGCTSDVSTGCNAVTEEFVRAAEQRTAEQPAAGVTNSGIGSGKLGGA